MKKNKSRLLMIGFTLQGSVALGLIFIMKGHLSVPSSKFTVHYQTSAYSIFGLVFVINLIWFLLVLFSLFRWDKFEKLQYRSEEFFNNKRNSTLVITAALLIVYVSGQLLLQIQGNENPPQSWFLMFTQPVWWWLIIICSELILVTFVIRNSGNLIIERKFLSIIVIFLLLSLTLFGLVRLGFRFSAAAENSNFDVLGNPILGYQVVLAVIAAILFYLLEKPALVYIKSQQWFSPKHFDILIAVFIFLGAILIWNKSPLNSNPFIGQPGPPNYEIYPVSDAVLYDRTAQSLLASGSLQSNLDSAPIDVGLRPAYTTMLAIIHSIGGLGYEDIIPFMIFGSALLPVLIFFLAKTIHNRTSGLLAAILVIIRDYNGQLLENIDAGVHAKMIMSDTPIIIGVILFLLLIMKWSRSEDKSVVLPFLSGGILGFTMLIRPEALVILPAAGLVYLLFQGKKANQFIRKVMVLIAGIVIVISPWIWRNFHNTGQIYLSSPGKLERIFDDLKEIFEDSGLRNSSDTSSLNSFGGLSFTDQIQEKEGAPFLFSIIEPVRDYSAGDDQEPFRLMLDHFSNSLIQSVLFLPSNAQMLNIDYLAKLANGRVDHYYGGVFYSPKNYVKSLPYWNPDWDGNISSRSVLLLELNLVLLSIGFLAVTDRSKPGSWILILF
ncbi:MAG: ArnT family glycosyltransferase, partial [Anaerolineales bacterium]